MSNSLYKKLKIIGLYVLSVAVLLVYWYMDNSTELNDFLKKADRVGTDWGFGFYAIVGLVQYVLLIVGLSTPIILTIILIIEKINNSTQ